MPASKDAFSFLTAQEIRFGRGATQGIASAIGGLGSAVFVVHGANSSRAKWLMDDLASKGLRVESFACAAEPVVATIEMAVDRARAFGTDCVVAIGGGAAIDAGKAVAALVPSERPMMDHLEVVGKGLPLDHPPLPLVALPTTAGTGSEVTKNAVIGVPEHGRKVSLRDNRMLANIAVVDPALTDNTPRAVTLASGLDAVTQVIEPYVSCKANRMTDALCRDAVPQGLRALVRLMEVEDTAARDDLAWTSLCGGLALANSGLGAVHGLAGVIGGMTSAPHGAVCGVLLPHVLAANSAAADLPEQARYRLAEVRGWVASALSVDPSAAFTMLADWSRNCGLPTLGEMEVATEDIGTIAEASVSSSSMKGNPVPLSAQALADMQRAAF